MDDIHHWFGLSYSNYLVLPRAVLQSMPEAWQARFVGMLDELRKAAEQAHLESPSRYRVHAIDAGGRYVCDPVPHYRHAPNLLGRSQI
jgi:hypothetical protein